MPINGLPDKPLLPADRGICHLRSSHFYSPLAPRRKPAKTYRQGLQARLTGKAYRQGLQARLTGSCDETDPDDAGQAAARSYLVDARMAPVSSSRRGRGARVIRVDDALGGAARCRLSTLRQRGVTALDVAAAVSGYDLKADRIVRAISLGQSRRCHQNRDGRQDRQSRNAHHHLPRD